MHQNHPGSVDSVVVIGGGLIGLCCAYFLNQRGLTVTLLERERVGAGASRGNAGEICPELATPLSTPGIVRHSLGSVFNRDSALFIHPQLNRDLVRFLARFILNTSPVRYRAGVETLRELSADTFQLFDEFESIGISLQAVRDGFLFVYKSREAALSAQRARRALGVGSEDDGLLEFDELQKLEPNLSAVPRAGYLLKNVWSIDPNRLIDQLTEHLRAAGVEIVESARVTAVIPRADHVEVRSTRGTVDASITVVAAGVWTRDLCRTLGVDLDIFAGKGYSFAVDFPEPLRRNIQFADVHVVATPLEREVRIAGTMELDKRRDHFNGQRVRSIVTAARPYLKEMDWEDRRDEWVGARPMTGDGLPIVGALPGNPRVIVAAGHNMHGLTLGPATGRFVSDLITGAFPTENPNPFDPALHGRARRIRRR